MNPKLVIDDNATDPQRVRRNWQIIRRAIESGELSDGAAAAGAVRTELQAHAALATTAHHGVVATTDARLSDPRPPTSHANRHGSAGDDALTLDQSQVTGLGAALAAKANVSNPVFAGVLNVPTGTPATPGSSGTAGDVCWDGSYWYVCVAQNTWKRAALSTW